MRQTDNVLDRLGVPHKIGYDSSYFLNVKLTGGLIDSSYLLNVKSTGGLIWS